MDIVTRTRMLGDAHASDDIDVASARNALHRSIASSKRRSRAPLFAWAAGGLTAGAGAFALAGIIIASSVVAPGAAAPASAAEVLISTATAIEKQNNASLAPADGQYLRVTETTEQLLTLGPDTGVAGDSPFAIYQQTGATGGALTESVTATYVPGDREKHPNVEDSSGMYVTETYGDKSAVESAWNSYYAGSYSTLGERPEHEVIAYNTFQDVGDGKLADLTPAPEGYPTDPAAFRDWFVQQRLTATGLTPTAEDLESVTPLMLWEVADARWATWPDDYRATMLRAIALDTSVTVDSSTEKSSTLKYTNASTTATVTFDTERQLVTTSTWDYTSSEVPDPSRTDGSLITREVGTSDIFPASVPRMTITLQFDIVDSAPSAELQD